MKRKIFWCTLIALVLVIAALFLRYHPPTNVMFEMKTKHVAFQYPYFENSNPLRLKSYFEYNKMVAGSFHIADFASGTMFNQKYPKKSFRVNKLIIKEISENRNINLEIIPLNNKKIKLIEWNIRPGTRIILDQEESQIQVKFRHLATFPESYSDKMQIDIPESIMLRLNNCKILDDDSPLCVVDSGSTVCLQWIPDKPLKNVFLSASAKKSAYIFELDPAMESLDLFSALQTGLIDFIDSIRVKSDLIIESAVMDSSRIRIFDSERRTIPLEKGDFFQTDCDRFYLERLRLTRQGFWMYFQGKCQKLETSRVGPFGFTSANYIDINLIKYKKNNILAAFRDFF